ncbi:hypothetical protein [Arthrobacter psychrochitiniphilus]|uniref:hypothetical protein n=1 Tax=Arthrobacter psychrochitiniphilus TaxID=291045 RepID=UPI003F7C687B
MQVQLRDGGVRWSGRGVNQAVAAVTGEMAGLLGSQAWGSLAQLYAALCELDGTANRGRLAASSGCPFPTST